MIQWYHTNTTVGVNGDGAYTCSIQFAIAFSTIFGFAGCSDSTNAALLFNIDTYNTSSCLAVYNNLADKNKRTIRHCFCMVYGV